MTVTTRVLGVLSVFHLCVDHDSVHVIQLISNKDHDLIRDSSYDR